MVTSLKSGGLTGVDGYIVDVEVDFIKTLPSFEIVGLADTAVKESKERVRSALKNNYIEMPAVKFTVNLAPASLKKEGVMYDLPIALGIAARLGKISDSVFSDAMFIGELSLSGQIRKVSGVLPCVLCAKEKGLKKAFVPYENATEASVAEGIEIYPCQTLSQVIEHFSGKKPIEPVKSDVKKYFENKATYDIDFSEVKGQPFAKRALEIAAAGGHNCVMIGTPGSGKTMLAKRIPTILPDLTFDEAIETTKIHSISGLLDKSSPIMTKRPFRSPHHTVSAAGLAGGGAIPRPGEVSLAHNGVLFLDEFPEFRKDAIEILRQPIEDRKITVSRVNSTVTYPSSFMLIAAMNPCKCGYHGDPTHECTCTQSQIHSYMSKISGPVMDRIDIHIQVNPVKYEDLENKIPAESSDKIKTRVNKARQIQLKRFEKEGIYCNAQMNTALIKKYCILGEAENQILKTAFDRLGLSARAYDKILKLARTIADLEGSEGIKSIHLREAIMLRSLDKSQKYI